MEAQATLVDIDAGPDALDQLSLVDHFSGASGKEDENVERAAADMKRRALLLQEPGLRKQSKWPKRKWPNLRYDLARAIAPSKGVKRYYFLI
ncbi:hypothetical protein ACVWZ6_007396 [Bradyrhizobium sp. GM6.1]